MVLAVVLGGSTGVELVTVLQVLIELVKRCSTMGGNGSS